MVLVNNIIILYKMVIRKVVYDVDDLVLVRSLFGIIMGFYIIFVMFGVGLFLMILMVELIY